MFEDRLKKMRIAKGLNMKQAAKEMGLSYTTYVGYEKNEREPNSETLSLLADFFSCSTDYLIGRSEQIYFTLIIVIFLHSMTFKKPHSKAIFCLYISFINSIKITQNRRNV